MLLAKLITVDYNVVYIQQLFRLVYRPIWKLEWASGLLSQYSPHWNVARRRCEWVSPALHRATGKRQRHRVYRISSQPPAPHKLLVFLCSIAATRVPDSTWISVERTTLSRLWQTATTTAVGVVSETDRTPNSTPNSWRPCLRRCRSSPMEQPISADVVTSQSLATLK